ncbi:hypothetical protein POM88_039754 [Heracleum sosnowskyi]|uniref:Uncharacterized protein n=1 Tax=Heracleum sosnowskyi TaxID=360622 RepID=A0AAD8HCS6_9APIA|nr:hypothetical protein POM88_039754 [Heracleum sosnowskyi]
MQENKEEDKGTMEAVENQMDDCDDTKNIACDVPAPVDDSVSEKVVGKIMNVKLSPPDEFYEKLTRFYDSSGLTLIFNFRKTRVNLYNFYKDVTERGGFCQVNKDGKWNEVASSFNAESSVIIPQNQIQMLYANIFYQFEQTYYYRTNSKVKGAQPFKSAPTGRSSCADESSGSPIKKQKHYENDDDGLVEKRVSLQSSFQLPTAIKSMEKTPLLQVPPEETNLVLKTPTKAKKSKKSSIKEMKQHTSAPLGLRTAYMIFLRMECERLKMIYGKGSPGLIKNMANDAWKHLSEHDRQPYIEASKRDKERYTRDMIEFNIAQDQIAATESVSASTNKERYTQEMTEFKIAQDQIAATESVSASTNKEIYTREMTEFKIAQDQIAATESVSASTNFTNVNNFAKPSLQTNGDHHTTLPDDAYHVSLPRDASDNVVTQDEELAADVMQKASSNDLTFHEELGADNLQKVESNDPTSQINWDGST